MLTQLILALLAAVILGVALLLWGLRGRRINDHPTCRQCRFDLMGQPMPLTMCPECGCGLKQPGRVMNGARKRYPLVAAVGVVLTLAPLLTVGSAMFATTAGVDLVTIKPLLLLNLETRHGSASLARKAADEILARAQAKKLSKAELQRAVDSALDVQADTSQPFPAALGDVIELAISTSVISDDQRTRYLRQACVFEFAAREKVTAGALLPLGVMLKDTRIGSATRMSGEIVLTQANLAGREVSREVRSPPPLADVLSRRSLEIDSHEIAPSSADGSLFVHGPSPYPGRLGDTDEARALLKVPSDLPPGRYRGAATFRITLDECSVLPMVFTPGTTPQNDEIVLNHEFNFEVVDEIAATVRLNPSLAVKAELQAALRPASHTQVTIHNKGARVDPVFTIREGLPPFSYDVMLRVADQQQHLGFLSNGRHVKPQDMAYARMYGQPGSRRFFAWAARADASPIEIVLRPNPLSALHTIELTEVCAAELVYRYNEQRRQFEPLLDASESAQQSGKPAPSEMQGSTPPKLDGQQH